MRIDIIGQRSDLRAERLLVLPAAAIAVKLDVGEMTAMTFEQSHRLEGGRPVAGHAEVVGVDVHRMGQTQLVDRLSHRPDDLPGGDPEAIDRRIEVFDVARLTLLPELDAARIDELGRIPFGRTQQPADECLGASGIPARWIDFMT